MKKLVLALAFAVMCFAVMTDFARAADKPKVGVAIKSMENSYFAGVFDVAAQLMKDKGWDYTILGCKDNSATQIQQVENFITNDVDLIMVDPSDPNSIDDYLAVAQKDGIKVMCWDIDLKNTDINWLLDNTKLGYAIGSEAAKFINEHYSTSNKAEIAIINYPQTHFLIDRENGILKALKDHAGGKYEVVAQQPALDAGTALTNMETIFQAHPNVKVVCSIGAGGDIGANEAFMTKYDGKIPADVGIFSADGTEQQLEAIVKGQATRATIGFEGSNKKTAETVVGLYEKLLNNESFPDKRIYRDLLVIDETNAAKYLADFK